MKRATCPGCGSPASYLMVRYCLACLHDMTRIMKGDT